MSMIARAAQFSPFAALVGYDESVRETGRLTEEKVVLDDTAIEKIDAKLRAVDGTNECVTITYFLPDALKEGGAYTIVTGEVKKIDVIEGKVFMKDGTAIPIEDIFDIEVSGYPHIQ